jgi:heat shock protein HslJ
VHPVEPTPDDLWGRTFVSVSVTEDGEPRPLIPGTRIELTFEQRRDEGGIRWEAGCNIQGARVDIMPQRLHVGEVAGTLIGCTKELYKQDHWLAAIFSSDPYWELYQDRPKLRAGETLIELTSSRD